ncbi:hypothetical protein [Altererythrobacter litoralis]|uniref:Uncharacterized protein n=1 Tax=Altererythrobacter litoralis TaxID=3113904 RepID=A0ABU7GH93_9SPHN|nr:hypothetical protein [Erythrobacteraceae bacterium 1XM1-14]
MRIEIARHGAEERVAVVRADGSTARFRIQRKGPISHDIVHYCVESALGMRNGFWGMVASGEDPGAIADLAKVGGHASAKRVVAPDASLVELLQAERLVECFEAESWSGSEDDAGLLAMAEAGWAASHVPALDL